MRDHIACSSSSRLVKDLRSIDGTLRSICSLRFWSTPSRSLVAGRFIQGLEHKFQKHHRGPVRTLFEVFDTIKKLSADAIERASVAIPDGHYALARSPDMKFGEFPRHRRKSGHDTQRLAINRHSIRLPVPPDPRVIGFF